MDAVNKTAEEFDLYKAMPKENVVLVLSGLQAKGIKMCIATAVDRYHVGAPPYVAQTTMLQMKGENK